MDAGLPRRICFLFAFLLQKQRGVRNVEKRKKHLISGAFLLLSHVRHDADSSGRGEKLISHRPSLFSSGSEKSLQNETHSDWLKLKAEIPQRLISFKARANDGSGQTRPDQNNNPSSNYLVAEPLLVETRGNPSPVLLLGRCRDASAMAPRRIGRAGHPFPSFAHPLVSSSS